MSGQELDEAIERAAKRDRELDQKEGRMKAQLEEMRLARQKAEGELSQRLEEAEADA